MTIPLILLVVHFLADFPLQWNWMSLGKSKNTLKGLGALTSHVLVYSLCFLFWGLPFAAVTFATHWLTDFVTSRITSTLFPFVPAWPEFEKPPYIEWYNKDGEGWRSNHWFFVCIGADQLIHTVTLALTYKWLFL